MSKNRRRRYLVSAENSEALACSLVTSPAVEELFVAFSDEKPLIEKFADEKKHMITGVVAIPNKPIFRRDRNGEEYDLVFSADAIENMAKKYMKDFRQKNVTLQHQENADGIYMFEQWIKTSDEYDKSLSLGFSKDIPIGTWFQTYYVESNDVWQRITDGELRGFSLECVLGVEEFEKQIFEEETPEPKEEPIQEPTVEQTQEPSKDKSILDKILELINGRPIEDVAKEAPKTTEPVIEPIKEEPKEDVKEEPKEDTTEQKNEVIPNPLDEVVKNLRQEIETLKKSNSDLQSKLKEIGKQPSVNPTSTSPKGKNEGGVEGSQFRAWRKQVAEAMG